MNKVNMMREEVSGQLRPQTTTKGNIKVNKLITQKKKKSILGDPSDEGTHETQVFISTYGLETLLWRMTSQTKEETKSEECMKVLFTKDQKANTNTRSHLTNKK